MSELTHVVGQYLQLSPTGGLQLSSGSKQGQEKIIRRLLTSTTDLLSDLNYGAGLPRMIGSPGNEEQIKSIIKNQLKLEPIVQQNPPPSVGVFSDPDTGLYICTIIYVDNITLEQTSLKIPLSPNTGN